MPDRLSAGVRTGDTVVADAMASSDDAPEAKAIAGEMRGFRA
jgi:hypothetical protein